MASYSLLLVFIGTFLSCVLLTTSTSTPTTITTQPVTNSVNRGLYALTQSVNKTNYPDAPAQLLAIDEVTGITKVIGPVIAEDDDDGTPLYFSSVTGFTFYAGGVATDGRTFAVMVTASGNAVLATIDLSTGKAIKTLELNVTATGLYGLFLISVIGGEPYGAVLRAKRGNSYIDVGPFLPNGTIARQISYTHFVLVNQGVSGGNYFAFLQPDVGHELVDVATGTVTSIIGRNCWYNNQWVQASVAGQWGSVGFVDPSTGQPYVLIVHQLEQSQQYAISLAQLNDSTAYSTAYCRISWMSDVIAKYSQDDYLPGESAFDPAGNQFHTVIYYSNTAFLVTVALPSGKVVQNQLRWPTPDFRGGIRQMVYHLQR